jgi:hypothetical protein
MAGVYGKCATGADSPIHRPARVVKRGASRGLWGCFVFCTMAAYTHADVLPVPRFDTGAVHHDCPGALHQPASKAHNHQGQLQGI